MAIKIRPTFIPIGYSPDGENLNFAVHITIEDVDNNSADSILTYLDFVSDCPFSVKNKTTGKEVFRGKLNKDQLNQNLWNILVQPKEIDFTKPPESELSSLSKNDIVTFDSERPGELINELESLYVNSFAKHFANKSKEVILNTNDRKSFSEAIIKKTSSIQPVEKTDIDIKESSPNKPTIYEILSFINNYQELLEQLGFLFFKFDSLKETQLNDADEVYIELNSNSSYTSIVINPSISTAIKIDKSIKYFGVSRNNKVTPYINGYLNLNHKVNDIERYELHQFSAVESAYKLNDAYTLQSQNGKSTEENVSSLNTNGIYIIDNFRDQEKEDVISSNNEYKEKFHFEDLLIGYKVEIIDSNNLPRGLTDRKGFIISKSNAFESIQITESGWIDVDTTVEQINSKKLLGDIICKYDGWSLTVENPLQKIALQKAGEEIIENGKKIIPDHGDPLTHYLKNVCQIETEIKAKGLKTLRFGKEIRFVIRPILVGGIIDSTGANVNIKDYSKCINFLRKESISAPVIFLRDNIYRKSTDNKNELSSGKEGESAKTLVIRSTDNKTKSRESCERAIAPGGISWHIAEYHGVFDDMNTGIPSVKKLMRSARLLPKWNENNQEWEVGKGRLNPNGDRRTSVPYIVDPLSQCFEIVHIESDNDNPESLFSLPFTKNGDLKFWDSELNIHNVKIWRIILKEQKRKNSPGIKKGKKCSFGIDWYNRLINIYVPKGETLEFVLRSFPLENAEFNKLLISNDGVLEKYFADSSKSKILPSNAFFFNIRNPNLIAEEKFKVIHAVQKPLFNPKFIGNMVVQRTWNHDETSFALLTSSILFPGKTSKKLELFATWTDKVDDGINQNLIPQKFEDIYIDEYKLNGLIEKPTIIPNGAKDYILGEIEDYGQSINKTIVITTSITVSDFNKVHYCYSNGAITVTLPTATATNKGKYFIFKNRNTGVVTLSANGATIDGETNKTLNYTDKIQIESNGANWVLKDIPPIYIDTEKTFYVKHNLGDTKHRFVEYKLKATSRFTEFFPTPKDEDTNDFSVYSEQQLKLNIPSSQAPAAPKVAFIIPYFEWEFSKTERRRKGNRLRVYLERPWFSSGEGEKLAVIISNNPKYDSENNYYQYVSKWGRDVTTFGKNLLPLTPKNFANKVSVENSLTLNNLLFKKRIYDKSKNEITNTIERPFSAIVYDVELDKETNCWYADIEFEDVNAYFPFLQLSLARYQKDSIADEELSSSILCDFIQVAPTRTISYNKQGGYIELNLFGSVYKADYDSSKGKTVVKNEVYVAFIPKENSQESNNDILYSLNDDTPNKYDWKKVEHYTLLENGIVWKFKDISPFDNYTVLVKEFEVFKNSINDKQNPNPEKNPTKRLTFGDAIKS